MNKIQYILLACLLCCLTHSCKNSQPENKKGNPPTVLIFEKAPSQLSVEIGKRKSKFGTTQEGEIAFTGNNGSVQYFSPNRERDTLILFFSYDYEEISHLHMAFEVLYFYIKSGDTVLFSYDNNKYPTLKSYTSEQLTQQYNFCKDIPDRLSYFGFEPLTLLSNYFFWRVYKAKEKNEYIPEDPLSLYISMDTVLQQAKNYLQEYASLLEILHKEKELYSDFYDYYNYLLKRKNVYYENYFLYYAADLPQRTISNLNRIYDGYFNDAYSNYISYQHTVSNYLSMCKYIGFPLITKSKGTSYGSSYVDYRAVFDSISKRMDIPPKTHSYMLYNLLEDIMMTFPTEDIARYQEKYITLTGDSLRAENKLLEHGITETKNEDILLRDAKGNEINYETVRQEHKGKVLYVDFWASWCAPCRASMPEALKLRKEYAGKEVVFLYLALNDREDTWKAAATKEQLDINGISYFIVNSKSSKAIQELKVESIPRYLIYDKTGKLVYFRAPGPHGNEIREQLDKLLKE